MINKKIDRPCSAHKAWDTMTLEEKVETLYTWANYMTEWAESVYDFTAKVKRAMMGLNSSAQSALDATMQFTTKDGNGGTPPPKPPGTVGC